MGRGIRSAEARDRRVKRGELNKEQRSNSENIAACKEEIRRLEPFIKKEVQEEILGAIGVKLEEDGTSSSSADRHHESDGGVRKEVATSERGIKHEAAEPGTGSPSNAAASATADKRRRKDSGGAKEEGARNGGSTGSSSERREQKRRGV